MVGKTANVQEFIGGQLINSSINWRETTVLAQFDKGVDVNIERLQLTNDAYNIALNHINEGNIFEGLEYIYQARNNQGTLSYKFWLDYTQDLTNFIERGVIDVKAEMQDGNQQFSEQLEGITFGYLESEGIINDSDYVNIDYVVQKEFDPLEIATATIVIYIMVQALAENIKDLGKDTATGSGLLATGLTGGVAASIFTILAFILEIAYSAAIVAAIINLVRQILAYFIQPKRTHKAIKLKTLLEKACLYLGYGFETDINDLDYLVYLPSNRNPDLTDSKGIIQTLGSIKKGIPNDSDYGYNASEAFKLAENYLYAKKQIVNGVVQFRNQNSDYWKQLSTYVLPDVKDDQGIKYNTKELSANFIINFITDLSDNYTITNFKGTNYQVITDIKNPTQPQTNFVKGLEEVRIPVSLGSRKEKLSPLEGVLKSMASVADSAINVFGGRSNLANLVKSKIGLLKVSNNNHQIPKLLWVENGKIPEDHREKLSAKASYENHWISTSFVENGYFGQKILYIDKKIPFGLNDAIALIQSSKFVDNLGQEGEITSFKWDVGNQSAIASYFIRVPYTKNLKVTKIEGE